MTNPVFQVYKEIPTGIIVEDLSVDLNASSYDAGKALGFLVGFCEGILSFIGGDIPIQVANYADLNEYERMRAREWLVVLQEHHVGRKRSPVSDMVIKIKLELNHEPPRVLVYEIADVK